MDYLDVSEAEEMEILREIKKKKLIKRLIVIVVVAVLLAALMGAVWMAGYGVSKDKIDEMNEEIQILVNRIEELVNTPGIVTPVTPVIELDVISKEISEIGELATVEYLFTDAAKFTDHKQIKKWNVPLTEKSFTLKWDGKIKAGVDVTEVKIDLDENAHKLIVTVPQAEILSYEVDDESVEVLDETNNKFNPITVEDKVNFDTQTKDAMIERAIDNGLLEKAQQSAENIIRNLLMVNPAIGEDYAIEFEIGK